jgi:tRNA(Ser,Leu) C12 N-acetylase TAN1
MRRLLEDKVRDQIGANETWGMQVEKRRWQRYHTRDIVLRLAPALDRKVDLDHPDKLVRLDVVGKRTALSVLRPGDIFSVSALEEPGGVPPITPDEITLAGDAPSADARHH